MKRSFHRLRRATALLAAIAIAGFAGLAVSTPAQAAGPAHYATAGNATVSRATAGKAAAEVPAQFGTVAGTVTDTSSGRPVAGVSVTAGTTTEITDPVGHYNLTLPVGTYEVTASKYGYGKKAVSGVTVTESTITALDFGLTGAPRAILSGTVRDGSGHGWPLYAKVSVKGLPVAPAFTDPATGRYSFDLPAGASYTLSVTADYPGYEAVEQAVTLGSADVTQDVAVMVDPKACSAPGYAIRDYGLSEAFDAPTAPQGWAVVDNTPDGGWGFTDIGNRGNLTGGSGGFAMIDSDKLGVGKSQDSELRTPVLDLTGQAAPVIRFASDYRSFGGSVADLDLSLDSGQTWQNLLHYTDSVRGPRTEEVAIPQAAGKPGVQVRFHFTGRFAYWWEVDDVLIGSRACEPVRGGLVVGQVIDHNTGEGVNGATVTSLDQRADTAKAAATPDDPNLGDGFYWLFSHLTGDHPFSATGGAYSEHAKMVDVGSNWATRADFTLEAGRLSISPRKVEKTVKMGEQATAKLTIKNGGTRPADVKVGEKDAGFTLLAKLGTGAPVQKIAGKYTPYRLGAAGIGAKATGANKQATVPYAAPWADIADYPTPIMDNAVGVNGGKVYSVGGTPGTGIIGAGSVFDPATGAWTAIAGMATAREKPAGAFIGGKFYVVGGWGSDGNPVSSLEIYDPAANSWSAGAGIPTAFAASAAAVVDGKLYVVGGCDSTVCGKANVFAYDPAADGWRAVADYPLSMAWLSCGGIGGQVYCAGGTNDAGTTRQGYSYNPSANSWSAIPDMPIDLWASSYGVANGLLLASGGVTDGQANLTNQGLAFDPATRAWTPLANSNNTYYRGGGACGFYKVGGSTGNFNAQAKAEVLPGFDQCAAGAADVAWLAAAPATFTIDPGATVTVTVTFDASAESVSQPGTYAGQLTFATNTPYQVAPVDVTMNATPPKTWGKIAGTVVGVGCDGKARPLAGATVQLDSWATHYTLKTDANGGYALWLDKRNNPIDAIAAMDGWQPKYKQVKIVAGATTTVDWKLPTAQSCK
jgi:N-acetylneuraminic acid mutarotase